MAQSVYFAISFRSLKTPLSNTVPCPIVIVLHWRGERKLLPVPLIGLFFKSFRFNVSFLSLCSAEFLWFRLNCLSRSSYLILLLLCSVRFRTQKAKTVADLAAHLGRCLESLLPRNGGFGISTAIGQGEGILQHPATSSSSSWPPPATATANILSGAGLRPSPSSRPAARYDDTDQSLQ